MASTTGIQRGRSKRIRWTRKQRLELEKTVRNFNSRVKAAEKRGIDKSILPKPVKLQDVKKTIKTASELKSTISILKKANADTLVPDVSGVKTKWEVSINTSKKKGAVDIRREEIASNISTDRTLQRFPTERERVLKSIGIESTDTGEMILDKIDSWLQGDNLIKSELWRQNYLKTIQLNMELMELNGMPESVEELDELYQRIAKADLKDFLLAQLANPQQLAINTLLTSPTGRGATLAQMEEQANAFVTLLETWDKYL